MPIPVYLASLPGHRRADAQNSDELVILETVAALERRLDQGATQGGADRWAERRQLGVHRHQRRLLGAVEQEVVAHGQQHVDIAFEHDADKLSDVDYEEINAKLRAEARHVLHELDVGAEGFREQAEALIAEKLGDDR